MKRNVLFRMAVVLLILCATACSDDNEVKLENMTTLNMMDTSHGATTLGNSDIQIDEAYNFTSQNCLVAEIGTADGLDRVYPPALSDALIREAAVLPGHLYQAFPGGGFQEFPSGRTAFSIQGDYYQFYVLSEIKEEEKRTGAVVQFALVKMEDNGLPAYGETLVKVPHDISTEYFSYTFSDVDEIVLSEQMEQDMSYEMNGNELRVYWHNYPAEGTRYEIWLRKGYYFTQVYLEVG